jgi:hypothetical protein
VDKLIELSQRNKVGWQETADEDTFLASVGKFVVTIAKQSRKSYSFTIADQAGKTLEESREEESGFLIDDVHYDRLVKLHELARRRALNVDQALSEMLYSLEQIR